MQLCSSFVVQENVTDQVIKIDHLIFLIWTCRDRRDFARISDILLERIRHCQGLVPARTFCKHGLATSLSPLLSHFLKEAYLTPLPSSPFLNRFPSFIILFSLFTLHPLPSSMFFPLLSFSLFLALLLYSLYHLSPNSFRETLRT